MNCKMVSVFIMPIRVAKGQLIPKCPFGVIVLPTKFFKDFCPSLKKEVKSKKVPNQIIKKK